MGTFTLNIPHQVHLTDEQFYELCRANDPWQLELSATGQLRIMAPTGGESGLRNANLTTELTLWNRQTGLGKVFDSSTEFKLPSGAYRCPDVAWVALARWQALTLEDRRKFPPLCPDFVIELRSESDRLVDLQQKMQEYQDNGVQLGWLIDPFTPLVEIYRQGQGPERLTFTATHPPQLSGESILPGLVLDLTEILNP